jgi:hypothetical protein
MDEQEIVNRLKNWLPESWVCNWTTPTNPGAADVTLEVEGSSTSFAIIIRKDPRPRQFPFHFNAGDQGTVPILAAPRISPRLQGVLKENGWGWIDEAGNGLISVPGKLHIERTGNAPPPRSSRAFRFDTQLAHRVVHTLLDPSTSDEDWTLRKLQEASSNPLGKFPTPKIPSLGYLSNLVQSLIDDRFAERTGARSPFRISDAAGLLRHTGNSHSIHRRLIFSLRSGKLLKERTGFTSKELSGLVALASFSAADQLAPSVRVDQSWFAVSPRKYERFLQEIDGKEVESGANVQVILADDYVFQNLSPAHSPIPCTSPVQTYWDLIASGGRGEEAADTILEECLLPQWKQHGIVS